MSISKHNMDAYYDNVERNWKNGDGGWEGAYYGVFSDVIRENDYKVCAEVGIGYGFHAYQILKDTNVEKLYLVDPSKWYPGDAFAVIIKNHGGFEALVRKIKEKLSPFNERYVWLRKESATVSHEEIPDESLDAVFVDGDHSYNAVKQDLPFWWKKVKKGGQMLGDDYWMSGVNKAVNEFSNDIGVSFDFLYKKDGRQPDYKIYRFKKE